MRSATSTSSGRARVGGKVALGIDLGTSGARCACSGPGSRLLETHAVEYPPGGTRLEAYTTALEELCSSCSDAIRSDIGSVAVDGTSGTALLCDASDWSVLAGPLLYNEPANPSAVSDVASIAPPGHTTRSSTSTLCKLALWHRMGHIDAASSPLVMHQADWLNALLTGHPSTVTDFNNALKLGCDPALVGSVHPPFPDWILNSAYGQALPKDVVAPGTKIGSVSEDASARLGLPVGAAVCAGTTDSNAAFLAAGVDKPGLAVTSLGSTLAVKSMSSTRVDNADYGIYSHFLHNSWVVGGASNVGGETLRQFFTADELDELSAQIDPHSPCTYAYYPLPQGTVGERFPVCDASKQPELEPQPESRAEFLKCLLEGIARVERSAYDRLEDLGATPINCVITSGGGSKNEMWRLMRERVLQRCVEVAQHTEAAYGTALLAASALTESTP